MASSAAGMPPVRRRRVWRWVLRIVLAIVTLVIVLAIVGASYQAIKMRADARRFPEEGRLVDIGGYRLNINCAGQGSPTVILDTGLGVPAIVWNLAQPDISKFTRVCSYDRAGYGWSDPGPMPRTSAQIVKELHTLLHNAGEKPPFVLVGHSFGGFNVRVYNGQYPDEVAGMVLVDASHEDQTDYLPPAMKEAQAEQIKQLQAQQMLAPTLIRLGIVRWMARNQPAPPGMSKEFFEETIYLQMQPKNIDAISSEMMSLDVSSKEVRAAGDLGDKPLLVLTAAKRTDEKQLPKGTTQKDFDDYQKIWIDDLQMRQAHLSTHGQRILVPDSSHMIPLERPATIVSAVREVCTEVNTHSAPQARR